MLAGKLLDWEEERGTHFRSGLRLNRSVADAVGERALRIEGEVKGFSEGAEADGSLLVERASQGRASRRVQNHHEHQRVHDQSRSQVGKRCSEVVNQDKMLLKAAAVLHKFSAGSDVKLLGKHGMITGVIVVEGTPTLREQGACTVQASEVWPEPLAMPHGNGPSAIPEVVSAELEARDAAPYCTAAIHEAPRRLKNLAGHKSAALAASLYSAQLAF